jgi:hypothetical protein
MNMPHWRSMMDSQWLRYHDLQGRDVTVTIERVVAGEVIGNKGAKNKKPVLHFKAKNKPLAINATIGRTIERMYGPDTAEWIGKQITLYTSTTEMGGETVQCIRVRPGKPSGAATADNDREPGDDAEGGADGSS